MHFVFTTSGGITPFQRLGFPGLETPLACQGSEIMAFPLGPWGICRAGRELRVVPCVLGTPPRGTLRVPGDGDHEANWGNAGPNARTTFWAVW